MAKKSNTPKNLDSDVAKELEQALDVDLDRRCRRRSRHGGVDGGSGGADFAGRGRAGARGQAGEARCTGGPKAAPFKPAEKPVVPASRRRSCVRSIARPPTSGSERRLRAGQRRPPEGLPRAGDTASTAAPRTPSTGWWRCFRSPGSAAPPCSPTGCSARKSGGPAASTPGSSTATGSCLRGRHFRAGRPVLGLRGDDSPRPGDADRRAVDDRSGLPSRRARKPRPGPGHDGRPGRAPRGRGDGRRHRAHAGAGGGAGNAGPHRGQPDRAVLFGELPRASARWSTGWAASARPSSPMPSASAPRSPARTRRCATRSARRATSSATRSSTPRPSCR